MEEGIQNTTGYKPVDEAEIIEVGSSCGHANCGIHSSYEAWQKGCTAGKELEGAQR